MASVVTGWSKFTKLMSYHIFCNKYRNKLIAIMYRKCVTYKIW